MQLHFAMLCSPGLRPAAVLQALVQGERAKQLTPAGGAVAPRDVI